MPGPPAFTVCISNSEKFAKLPVTLLKSRGEGEVKSNKGETWFKYSKLLITSFLCNIPIKICDIGLRTVLKDYLTKNHTADSPRSYRVVLIGLL